MAAQRHFTQMRMRFDRFRSLLSKDEARGIVSNIAKLPRATKPPSDVLSASLALVALCNSRPGFYGSRRVVGYWDARVGRPLTPGSVAGVNPPVNRRAYYGAAGAAAAGAAAYGTYNYYQGRRACGCAPYPTCY